MKLDRICSLSEVEFVAEETGDSNRMRLRRVGRDRESGEGEYGEVVVVRSDLR